MATSKSNGSPRSSLYCGVAIASLIALLFGSAPALAAKRRIVLINFSGPKAKPAQKIITARLKREYVVLPEAAFVKTLKKLGVRRKANSDDVANVLRKLKADALVTGRMQKLRKRWQLTLTVRDQSSGLELDPVKIALKKPKLDRKALAAIDDELMPLLEGTEPNKEAPAEETPVAEATPSGDVENPLDSAKTGKRPDRPEPAQALREGDPTQAALGTERSSSGEEGSSELTATATEPGKRPAWRPLLLAQIGLGLTGRTFAFDSVGLKQTYSGFPVPAIDIGLEFFPMASSPGALRGLGIYAAFNRIIKVSTAYSGTEYGSSQQSIGFGASYGYRLREAADAITVGLRAGLGITSFEISVPPMPNPMPSTSGVQVPDVSYKYIDAGIFVKVPFQIAGSWWELGVRAAYLPVLSAGMLTEGGRDGRIDSVANGSASGLGGGLALKWNFSPRMSANLGFDLARFSTSFEQRATNANNTSGATDMFYNIGLAVGFQY